jgi:lipooligosaccharide transport system permease protein
MAALAGTLHVVEYNALVYRRIWRGSIAVSFFTPLFFLAAMGLGLGGLVNRASGGVDGVPYLAFLAPGLIAAATMQTAAVESTYPILAKIMWDRTYEAALATPVTITDLIRGEVLWVVVRTFIVSAMFYVVMLLFGVGHSVESVLAIPAAMLTGLAFATPIMAFTATRRNDSGFAAINRFVIIPLYLLGGTFFPIAKLPLALQAVAWATPLAHGVALSRGVALGNLSLGEAALHALVPLAYFVGGLVIARALLLKRLAR